MYPDARILWVDAHADANTPESTPSGNLHGCPIGYLSGLAKSEIKPVLSLKHLIYLGIRDLDPEEMNMINREKILWYKSSSCQPERIPQLKKEIEEYFFPANSVK